MSLELYQKEKDKHEEILAALRKKQHLLGWLRLAIVIIAGVIAFWLFSFSLIGGWIAVVVGIASFLFLVSVDAENNKKIDTHKTLAFINSEELKVLHNDYLHRYDGSNFMPAVHPYANDLDIFGSASLYQYINRCNSEQGKQKLAHDFLNPLPVVQILERQEAIKEMGSQFQWRQSLSAISLQEPITIATERKINQWLQVNDQHFTHPSWRVIVLIFSIFSIATAVAAIFGIIPPAIFSGLFLIYFIVGGNFSRKAMGAYNHLNGIVKEVSVLSQFIDCVESKNFDAPLLKTLQQSVRSDNQPASVQIKNLKAILDRFDLRLNVFLFLFLNSFLLWDVRQMMALNKWRKNNEETIPNWFKLVAEFEVLNSLATLQFNHPSWTLPVFTNKHFCFEGSDVGHPLIKEQQRVVSSFSLTGIGKIALITGSNMAGKSTFLRSLGVNVVLAQMGSPVCAKSLTLSPVQLLSSMRIADNLAENTSTFYAELKKLKTIIEAANRHEPVFILLDEILRGTNSLDRHTGSKALVKQLIKEDAVAVIATHDIELAKLEEKYPSAIHNYHFDVQVEGEELYFDYKLKEGVCTSLNASILMKKIGIDL